MDGQADSDEKVRKLMQQLMQSESEKHVMRYERDLLKEKLEETRQQQIETDRLMRAKHREVEVNRNRLKDLERECETMRLAIREREAIIEKAGLVLYGAESTKAADGVKPADNNVSLLLLSPDVADALERTDGASLDEKLRLWMSEAVDLRSKLKKYKEDLDRLVQHPSSSRGAARINSSVDSGAVEANAMISSNSQSYDALIELQKETSRQLSDSKMRLLKAQEERNTIEQQSARFEQQAKRYKQQAGEMEAENESLKQERRRLQKELREKDAQISELEFTIQERSRQIEKLQKRSTTAS
jgi:hypothetical protein